MTLCNLQFFISLIDFISNLLLFCKAFTSYAFFHFLKSFDRLLFLLFIVIFSKLSVSLFIAYFAKCLLVMYFFTIFIVKLL
jgi:hypothetical protein